MAPRKGEAIAGVVSVPFAVPQALHSERTERLQVLALTLLTDGLIFLFAFGVVTLTRAHTLIYVEQLWWLQRDQALITAFYLAVIMISGGYSPARLMDRFDAAYYSLVAIVVASLGMLALWSVLPDDVAALSRRELVLGTGLGCTILAGWRVYLSGLTSQFASLHRRFVILGGDAEASRICEEIRTSAGAYADVEYASLDELERELLQDAAAAERRFQHRDVILSLSRTDREQLIQNIEFCEKYFGRTFVYPTVHDTLLFPHSRFMAIGGIPLIEISSRYPDTPYLVLKRLVDLGVASLGLVLAAPLALVAAVAIVTTSPGPVFWTQERMGLHGRRFKLYKFRSMVDNAEAETGPVWATSNDARVTFVGRFLRKHRIDEIPQLLNVLKGDMSLIGPRPERPHFHDEFCAKWPLFSRRLAVRPGVTSLSHVLGSYDSDPADRLRYDLIYINNISLFMDIRILAATVRVVLGAKGAK